MNLYRLSPDYLLDPLLRKVPDHFREVFVAAEDRHQAALLHPGFRDVADVQAASSGVWPLSWNNVSDRWVRIPAHVIVEYLGPAMCGEDFGFIKPPV